MKKSVITLVLPLFAYAQMQITTVERVAVHVAPDVLRGSLGFEEQHKTPGIIKEHLNAIIAALRGFDPNGKICRGGGYRLSPLYSYKERKQEFVGYGGNLSFGCEFSTIEEVNALESVIDKATAASVRKQQGALSWGVSAEKGERSEQELRLALLRKARLQAEGFSKEMGFACDLEKINFSPSNRLMPIMAREMAASVPTESPIRADEEVSVEAVVDYSCVKRTP